MLISDYKPRADLLADRIVLVTGAGDGIGREAAVNFARHGATVILLGRTIKKLERTYDEIEKAGSPQAAIYPMNLEGAAPKDFEEMAATIEREFGRLDGLLHNAAILGTLTPVELYNIEEWHKVIQVNLNAPFMLTRACIGLLKQSDDASILFTSDQVGREGRAYWGAYGISKFGIEGLMQTLKQELETNTRIRVNSIDPGPVCTLMRMSAYPGENHTQLPAPADIMADYLYLMGPDSCEINGQAITAANPTQSENSKSTQ